MQSPTRRSEISNGSRRFASLAGRSGMTVLEILIAATLALLLIFAMVQIFEDAGKAITRARSSLEMSGRLRAAAYRMYLDLGGLTAPVRPTVSTSNGLGYFEFVEGPRRDYDADNDGTNDATQANSDQSAGDWDDVLMCTVQSTGEPFVGRFNGVSVESDVAEIAWWTEFKDDDSDGIWDFGEDINLYRRVLLVLPNLDPTVTGAANLTAFYASNDVSARNVGGTLTANSLSDLTMRENRFAHGGAFPHEVSRATLSSYVLSGTRLGEDVVMSNVVAFDIRAYDPQANIRTDGTVALIPSDLGYAAAATNIGQGAFVDLNYNTALASDFSDPPSALSQMTVPTYCTWSTHFEQDGINQDSDGVTDEGTNGLDDDGTNGVDDAGENETAPPYSQPLRGLKVIFRMVEFDTKQVRQTPVIADFVPE